MIPNPHYPAMGHVLDYWLHHLRTYHHYSAEDCQRIAQHLGLIVATYDREWITVVDPLVQAFSHWALGAGSAGSTPPRSVAPWGTFCEIPCNLWCTTEFLYSI